MSEMHGQADGVRAAKRYEAVRSFLDRLGL